MALFNTLLLLLVALAIPGLINRTRARLAGRKGIRFTQHLHNVWLLLHRGRLLDDHLDALPCRPLRLPGLGDHRRAAHSRGRPLADDLV